MKTFFKEKYFTNQACNIISILFCQFLDSNESLDILINNAGLFLDFDSEKILTQDGNELTIQSNHLGHFLLTNLLMEKLEETPGSRIVNVSSIGHKESKYEKFDVDDLNFKINDNIYMDMLPMLIPNLPTFYLPENWPKD